MFVSLDGEEYKWVVNNLMIFENRTTEQLRKLGKIIIAT